MKKSDLEIETQSFQDVIKAACVEQIIELLSIFFIIESATGKKLLFRKVGYKCVLYPK